jgi:hypothetical protein
MGIETIIIVGVATLLAGITWAIAIFIVARHEYNSREKSDGSLEKGSHIHRHL